MRFYVAGGGGSVGSKEDAAKGQKQAAELIAKMRAYSDRELAHVLGESAAELAAHYSPGQPQRLRAALMLTAVALTVASERLEKKRHG